MLLKKKKIELIIKTALLLQPDPHLKVRIHRLSVLAFRTAAPRPGTLQVRLTSASQLLHLSFSAHTEASLF